jgi:MSHA biogenesis protein MshJ
VKGGNIHKHGIEIRMAGNYLDLLAYVADLESLPQKLLWGNMALTVTAYPRSELTLTVYTLSLDPTWLVV